jgi:hypothetical protein
MKIAFMLVTRGHPRRAAAVLEVAKALASGEHEITYIVGFDDDDIETRRHFAARNTELVSIGPRPDGVGAVWNRCVEAVGDADVYCPFPNDVFIGVPGWDYGIATYMAAYMKKDSTAGILAWNDIATPKMCTLPIVSREWMKLLGGKLYDERFPFWFYDTAIDEIFSFVTGECVPIMEKLLLISNKGTTQNMRDLPFWWDFYSATRSDRMAQAAQIRTACHIAIDNRLLDEIAGLWRSRDAIGRDKAIVQEQESKMSAEGLRPPSKQYIRAREAAEAYLRKSVPTRKAGLQLGASL